MSTPSKSTGPFFLLHPNYRVTGYIIVVIGCLMAAWKRVVDTSMVLAGDAHKQSFPPERLTTVICIVLVTGLVCIAAARQKLEDQLMISLRLKSLAIAIMALVAYGLGTRLLGILQDTFIPELDLLQGIIAMLLVYLVSFKLFKKYALQ